MKKILFSLLLAPFALLLIPHPAHAQNSIVIESQANIPVLISGPDYATAKLFVSSPDGEPFEVTGTWGIDFRTGNPPGEATYFANPSPSVYGTITIPANGSAVDVGAALGATFQSQVVNNTGSCLTDIAGRAFARARYTPGDNVDVTIIPPNVKEINNIGAMIGNLTIERSDGSPASGASVVFSSPDGGQTPFKDGTYSWTYDADSFGRVVGIHRLNCSKTYDINVTLGTESGFRRLPPQPGGDSNTICNGQSRDFTIRLNPPGPPPTPTFTPTPTPLSGGGCLPGSYDTRCTTRSCDQVSYPGQCEREVWQCNAGGTWDYLYNDCGSGGCMGCSEPPPTPTSTVTPTPGSDQPCGSCAGGCGGDPNKSLCSDGATFSCQPSSQCFVNASNVCMWDPKNCVGDGGPMSCVECKYGTGIWSDQPATMLETYELSKSEGGNFGCGPNWEQQSYGPGKDEIQQHINDCDWVNKFGGGCTGEWSGDWDFERYDVKYCICGDTTAQWGGGGLSISPNPAAVGTTVTVEMASYKAYDQNSGPWATQVARPVYLGANTPSGARVSYGRPSATFDRPTTVVVGGWPRNYTQRVFQWQVPVDQVGTYQFRFYVEQVSWQCGSTYTLSVIGNLPEGFHEGDSSPPIRGSTECRAMGWASDRDNPNTRLNIRVFSDGVKVAEGIASTYRANLTALPGLCTGGNCSFNINLWGLISTGVSHSIKVEARDPQTGTWEQLTNVLTGTKVAMSLTCINPSIQGNVYNDPNNTCNVATASPVGGGGVWSTAVAKLDPMTAGEKLDPFNNANNSAFLFDNPTSGLHSLWLYKDSVTTLTSLPDNWVCAGCQPGCKGTVNAVSAPSSNNFFVRTMGSWFQTAGGDVHVQGSLSAMTPTSENFSLPVNNYPGVVSANGSATFNPGDVSSTGWLLDQNSSPPNGYSYDRYSSGVKYNYDYFYNMVKPTEALASGNGPIGCSPGGASGGGTDCEKILYWDGATKGDLTLSGNWVISGKKRFLIFVDGANLKIGPGLSADRIKIPQDGSFTFFVKKTSPSNGNIIIDEEVESIDGIYVADGQISTGTDGSDEQLEGNGVFVAHGGFNLQRKLDNINDPAEIFTYNPSYIMNAPKNIYPDDITWEEVAP
ncbi:hypothetical protein HY439_01990 [Candidatus Microgenomates bacterium]|nr:hypothetical protein [Candidatus Microgenomates bacterium]